MGVSVRNSDIDLTEKNMVTMKSPSLATALVRSREEGGDSDIVNLLKHVDNGFSLDNVRINSSGAVVVESEALYSTLRDSFNNAAPGTLMADNGVCGANCEDQ